LSRGKFRKIEQKIKIIKSNLAFLLYGGGEGETNDPKVPPGLGRADIEFIDGSYFTVREWDWKRG